MADFMTTTERDEILGRLALYRYTVGDRREPRFSPGDALSDLYAVLTGAWASSGGTAGLPSADQIPLDDVVAALRLVPGERSILEMEERDLIEAAMDRGETWVTLAERLGYKSRQTLQQRYRRQLGGRKTWPSGPRPSGRTGDTPQ